MASLSKNDRAYLESALKEAHEHYTLTNPKSKKSNEDTCNWLPGASGNGCILKTIDGQEYVDFLGEYTAGIYGHSHPVIRQAIDKALNNGWNYGGSNKMEHQLAKIVCERFPPMEKVRFVNSGTEANMLALATAIVYTGKKKILVFNKGYHGSTIWGHISTGKPTINLPHDFVVGHYNDIEGTKTLVYSLPADSLAAILVEPSLGSGGCYQGTPEFLSTLRHIATDNQALLILDEVMTSRMSYGGLGARMGVTPDLMTLGKWVGGGMSFGAFGGRDDIMSMFDPRKGVLEHPGTFNNNVFSMSAGVAGCTLLTEEVIDNLHKLGKSFTEAVERVLASEEFGITGTIPTAPLADEMQESSHPKRPPKVFIKGVGSLASIHFAGPDRELLQGLFYHHMLQSAIYMASRGFVALSILITQQHIEKFVQAVETFCRTWSYYLRW